MLALAAALVLASNDPSAANLAPHFLEVQAASPSEQPTQLSPPPADRYAGWSHAQLLDEKIRLEASKPSLGTSIAFIAGGGGCAIVDLFILFFAGLVALIGGNISVPVVVLMVVLGLIGVGGIITGLVFLFPVLHERSAVNAEIEALDHALEPGENAPPVPPPPVMAPPVQVEGPRRFITLATF